jgi:hypothetical protein
MKEKPISDLLELVFIDNCNHILLIEKRQPEGNY